MSNPKICRRLPITIWCSYPEGVRRSFFILPEDRFRNFSAMRTYPQRWIFIHIFLWKARKTPRWCLTRFWWAKRRDDYPICCLEILLDVLLDAGHFGVFRKINGLKKLWKKPEIIRFRAFYMVHQRRIIRTRFPLGMGSDYCFISRDLKIGTSETAL